MTPKRKSLPPLGEDWWALIIGLVLAALVWVGLIGEVPWPVFGWLK